jgi:hypothetical protein
MTQSMKTNRKKRDERYKTIDFLFDPLLARALVALRAKNLAALGAPALQHLPASRGLHSLAKPVDTRQ